MTRGAATGEAFHRHASASTWNPSTARRAANEYTELAHRHIVPRWPIRQVGLPYGLLVVFAVIARPLLFASLDPDVAAARGVPVRALGLSFMILLAVTVGTPTLAVGALLTALRYGLFHAYAVVLITPSLLVLVSGGLIILLGLAIAPLTEWGCPVPRSAP